MTCVTPIGDGHIVTQFRRNISHLLVLPVLFHSDTRIAFLIKTYSFTPCVIPFKTHLLDSKFLPSASTVIDPDVADSLPIWSCFPGTSKMPCERTMLVIKSHTQILLVVGVHSIIIYLKCNANIVVKDSFRMTLHSQLFGRKKAAAIRLKLQFCVSEKVLMQFSIKFTKLMC